MEFLRGIKNRSSLVETVLFSPRDIEEIVPNGGEIVFAKKLTDEIKNLSKKGQPKVIPLEGSIDSLQHFENFGKMKQIISDFPCDVTTWDLTSGGDCRKKEVILTLGKELGVYPKKFPKNLDRCIYFDSIAYMKEGTVEEVIHNVYRIKGLKQTFWHELIIGVSYAGNIPLVAITVGKDYSRVVNSSSVIAQTARQEFSNNFWAWLENRAKE